MLGFGIVIPLLPFYALKFNASVPQITLMLSVAAFCQFIATPILGSVSDRIGRRPVLIFSQLGTVTAGVVLGLATILHFQNPFIGLVIIYLSRIIDGISGGNVSTAQAYVSDISTHADKAKRMGMLGAAFGIGFALGPAIGGLVGYFNPSIPPFIAASLSLTAALFSFKKLPESLEKSDSSRTGLAYRSLRQADAAADPCAIGSGLVYIDVCLCHCRGDSCDLPQISLSLHRTRRRSHLHGGRCDDHHQCKMIGPLKKHFGEWSLAIIGPICFSIAMLLYARAGTMFNLLAAGCRHRLQRDGPQPADSHALNACFASFSKSKAR